MTIAVVQTTTAKVTSSGGSSESITSTAAAQWAAVPTAGNSILSLVTGFNNSTGAGIVGVAPTDTASNTHSIATHIENGIQEIHQCIAQAIATATPYTETFTWTPVLTIFNSLIDLEISGLAASALDTTGTILDVTGTATALTPVTSASVSQPNYIAVSQIQVNTGGTVTFTTPSGWTSIYAQGNSGVANVVAFAYKIVTGGSLTTVSAPWTWSGAGNTFAIGNIAIYKDVVSGSAGAVYTPYTRTQFFVSDTVIQS